MDKLRWEVKFPNKFSDEEDFLETILENYGITDIPSFLHPQKEKVLNDPFLMKNMEKAVGLFHNNLNAKFVIKVDCD